MMRFPRRQRPPTRTEILRDAARAIRARNAALAAPAAAARPVLDPVTADLLAAGFTLREISLGAGKG